MMKSTPHGRKGTHHYGNIPANQMTFCRWLISMGYLQKLIALTLIIMVLTPLVAHYYLSVAEMSNGGRFEGDSRLNKLMAMKPTDLRSHVEELYDIRESVQKELRQLEESRKKVQEQLQVIEGQLSSARKELWTSQDALSKVRTQIDQSMKEQTEIVERSLRHISAPIQILPQLKVEVLEAPDNVLSCKQHNCFDYSRCSIVSPFRVYMYNPEAIMSIQSSAIDLQSSITGALKRTSYVTSDPSRACLFIVFLWDSTEEDIDEDDLEGRLHSLEFWQGDGRNHLLISIAKGLSSRDIVGNVNFGRAILVQSFFTSKNFRKGFDIVLPPLFSVLRTSWKGGKFGPSFSPARRKFILSFQGSKPKYVAGDIKVGIDKDHMSRRLSWFEKKPTIEGGSEIESKIMAEFDKMRTYTDDQVLLDFICPDSTCDASNVMWCLCGNEEQRTYVLEQSTFVLILASNDSIVSSLSLLQRLSEALRSGAIPVVLGEHVALPFEEYIQWNKAVILLPLARVTELYYLLKTIQDSDLLLLRRQGAVLWDTYFSSPQSILAGVLANIRTRVSVPANPVMGANSKDMFPPGSQRKTEKVTKFTPESDDIFPPAEPPFSSPTFLRNFTHTYIDWDLAWNNPPGPFYLFPQNPLDPVMPSEAKFKGSSLGFRPVAKGIGGSGKEFQASLGGNIPREQFTIVILTYQREAVMVSSVERLLGIPFLNKVIIVWNSPQPPAEDLVWPEIHVPVKVLKGGKNSLNNRFLPFDEIETEAVLSIDDDAHLRHDEILFGFRVWRENRDRIVGFPGRFHAWDIENNSGFFYNANYSCELSMVLTGAAFLHKYYLYQYTYFMPQEIRDKVDEFMNCEDIAMNFLVSHITRKPPVKVTSRWTFRCPGCPQSLSMDDSHFRERHICIQYFAKVFGYTPLLYTQYRVDSVLFKTRLPKDMQKCFKFI